ncbi:hypothetical protein BH11BAC3_BH11BAC3_20750 [soil metagenome]
MIKLLLLCCAIFVANAYSSAQSIIPRFENLGVNDGLPHSSVYSITQDKKGFMWFGTADGLCRYDGKILKTFKYAAQYKNDVVNNFIRGKILEDKAGSIWYCNESGIYKWDHIKELVVRVKTFDKTAYKSGGFQSVYLDTENCMWLFNICYGLFSFNISTQEMKAYPFPYKIDLSDIILRCVTTDDTGNIWLRIGNKKDPFVLFDHLTHQYSIQFEADPPQNIFFDKQKKILAYDDRLVMPDKTVPKIIDGKRVAFYSYEGISDEYGRLWMTARGNGLFYYDEHTNLFHEFHHDNSKIKSLPFDLTTCLFIDRNRNLWIGIDGAGVAKLDLKQPRFNLFPLSDGDFPELNDYFTKCFYEDSVGRIWFGSHSNGLNIYDPSKQELVNYRFKQGEKNGLPGNIIGSILKDKDGNMWIGSSGGISLFDESKKTFTTIPIRNLPKLYPLMNTFVYKMVQLQNGNFLAGTLLGIISVTKDATGNYTGNYFNNMGHLLSVTVDIAEMPDQTIYAAMPGLGLYHIKPQGNSYAFLDVFLPGIDLRSVRLDEKKAGYLWIGSGKGLIHFNTINHAYTTWDEKNGMANSYVYGSLEDKAGNLWISTNKGLSFFNIEKNSFDNYSFQDGLQSNEFNTQSFYKSQSGNFYFGGIKGFNWFKPGDISKHFQQPEAAITHIAINDSVFIKDAAFLLDHTITVPYYKNDFSFQFAALDYTRPEANKVLCFLQGWDDGWILEDNRSARYTHLPPGKYTLRVKVSNAAGVWSKEQSVTILIKSPFWKRTWFTVTLWVLLLSAIVFSTYKISQAKAKRKLQLLERQIAVDAERNRISADMHDEIGSGITHIALLSELIQTQQKDEKGLKKDIKVIAVSARKLVQTMSEIIWALNPQNDTLENLLAYTREQSQQDFESMDIHLNIDFPDMVPDIKLTNVQRRNLYLVTREALNNALKHSDGTEIQLKLEVIQRSFCFSVSDNGKGFDESKAKPGSNGLINMKKRMGDIGGTIDWELSKKGTNVKFCISL